MSAAEEIAFRCTAGRCAFWVTWEGKLLPCGLLSEVQADAVSQGFEKAWREVRRMTKEVPTCEECRSCENYTDCMVCPSRLKLETGGYTKPAPYLCEFTRAWVKIVSQQRTLIKYDAEIMLQIYRKGKHL